MSGTCSVLSSLPKTLKKHKEYFIVKINCNLLTKFD